MPSKQLIRVRFPAIALFAHIKINNIKFARMSYYKFQKFVYWGTAGLLLVAASVKASAKELLLYLEESKTLRCIFIPILEWIAKLIFIFLQLHRAYYFGLVFNIKFIIPCEDLHSRGKVFWSNWRKWHTCVEYWFQFDVWCTNKFTYRIPPLNTFHVYTSAAQR